MISLSTQQKIKLKYIAYIFHSIFWQYKYVMLPKMSSVMYQRKVSPYSITSLHITMWNWWKMSGKKTLYFYSFLNLCFSRKYMRTRLGAEWYAITACPLSTRKVFKTSWLINIASDKNIKNLSIPLNIGFVNYRSILDRVRDQYLLKSFPYFSRKFRQWNNNYFWTETVYTEKVQKRNTSF